MKKQEAQALAYQLYHESLELAELGFYALTEEERQYMHGQRSGCLRAALVLAQYGRGRRTLSDTRHYLSYLSRSEEKIDTPYNTGIREVFRRVLLAIAPVPRRKKEANNE